MRLLRVALVGACTACVLVVASDRASAQLPGTRFYLSGGAAFPTGDFSSVADIGFNVGAGFGVTQRGSPIGFRLEGLYSEFNEPDVSDNAHAAAITANATYDFNGGSLTPVGTLYLIGGLGYYNTRDPFVDFFTDQSQSNIGWNIGAGYRFPLTGFSAYFEARFHTVSNTEIRFIPVSFGLIF